MSQQREFEEGGGTQRSKPERLDLSLSKGAVSHFYSTKSGPSILTHNKLDPRKGKPNGWS